MDIDQRLEALTQTVELLAGMHRDSEHRIDRVAERIDRLTQNIEGMRGFISDIAQSTARLLNIVESHEHRLDSRNDCFHKLEA